MRHGFSTGACATAAAVAAACRAAGKAVPESVEIPFPDGSRRALPVAWVERHGAGAAVIKDAGDDPDITHGATVHVRLAPAPGWIFEAGEGVGTVTRPGLQIPVGEPAINPGPRAMIQHALEELGWEGARITISIPGGSALAERTFNPRLGVAGGLSILGTAGIVRPFSLEAIRATIQAALDVARAAGHTSVCLVPGHLGERAAQAALALDPMQVVEVSNEWGFALDAVRALGFRHLVAAGHPGKLAKLAEGHFDTHSSRSPSPNPALALRLQALGLPVAEAPTVEGRFQALSTPQRLRLATHLGSDIARAVEHRAGMPCQVLLTDMAGGLYGGWPALPSNAQETP